MAAREQRGEPLRSGGGEGPRTEVTCLGTATWPLTRAVKKLRFQGREEGKNVVCPQKLGVKEKFGWGAALVGESREKPVNEGSGGLKENTPS